MYVTATECLPTMRKALGSIPSTGGKGIEALALPDLSAPISPSMSRLVSGTVWTRKPS